LQAITLCLRPDLRGRLFDTVSDQALDLNEEAVRPSPFDVDLTSFLVCAIPFTICPFALSLSRSFGLGQDGPKGRDMLV
jgi:hypothetical protein